jgi:hypothetical protein
VQGVNCPPQRFYAWLKEPQSHAAKDNERLLKKLKPVMYKVAVCMAVHASHMSCAVWVKHAVKTLLQS